MLSVIALAIALQAPQGSYADEATARLVERARERHRALDAAVRDYRAIVRTRLDAHFAQGRFARLLPLVALEQVAELWWQAPNDLKLVTRGQRSRTAFRGAQVNARWSRPWFIPRFLGDSIRVLSDDFPSTAAVHPLAPGAEALYRYAVEDSLELALPGRSVRAVAVRITPVRVADALVAGQLWLDAETAETVRFQFTFVGSRLWAEPKGSTRRDSVRAQRDDDRVSRVLRVSVDLEYGLFEQRFWLPYQQSVLLDVEVPNGGIVVPVNFRTTFSNVEVNGGVPIAFTVPVPDTGDVARVAEGRRGEVAVGARGGSRERRRDDSREVREGYSSAGRWPGGRYEILVPPDSALREYAGWPDSLDLSLTREESEELDDLRRETLATVGRLPSGLFRRPGRTPTVDWLSEASRYNRAEGTAMGVSAHWQPLVAFPSLGLRLRYTLNDRRLQAALTVRHDRVGSRFEASAFREMRDSDPLSPGLTFGNSLRAALLAHDDGAYVFAEGVELRRRFTWRSAADVTVGARIAHEDAPRRLAHGRLNDLLGGSGEFQPLDPVLPGTYLGAEAGMAGGRTPTRWRAGADVAAGASRVAGRVWAAARTSVRLPPGLDVSLSGWLGAGLGDSVPQRRFRIGGSQSLRGLEAGALSGATAYAGSLDVTLARGLVSPVAFADVGSVGPRSFDFGGPRRFSAGAGLSAFSGLVRVHAARLLEHNARWRLDLVFGSI